MPRKKQRADKIGARESQESDLISLSPEKVIIADIILFHSYFDVVRGLISGTTPLDARRAYGKMLAIQTKYSDNAVLLNKLDEAGAYLLKYGKR